MADERLRTKRELKRLFTNLKRKGISDDMISILIDTLWRDRSNQRSGGFYHAGSYDSEISFDINTRIFSIKPFDPLVEGFEPRYSVFSWSNKAVLHRIFTPHEIEIPNEEGLFCIYFDKEPDPGTNQILTYIKNPGPQELEIIYLSKVLISFFTGMQQTTKSFILVTTAMAANGTRKSTGIFTPPKAHKENPGCSLPTTF